MGWGNDPAVGQGQGGAQTPTWGQNDPAVRTLSTPEALGRGFEGGGGTLLNTLGALGTALLPTTGPGGPLAPAGSTDSSLRDELIKAGVNPQIAQDVSTQQGAGTVYSDLGKAAQQDAAVKPNETLDSYGKVAMGLGGAVPVVAGAVATGGGASAEGLIPGAVKAIPYLGRIASAFGAGAGTAGALTTEQVANADKNATAGSLVRDAGINLALAGIPGAVGDSALVRALTGGALGYGTSAASSALQGKDQDQANNLVGALMGAGLAGGHAPAEAMDPYLRNYTEGQAETPAPAPPPAPIQRALPAPTSEAPTEPAAPAPSPAPVAPSAPQADPHALAAESFRQDPKTALSALPHDALVQVAQDAGLDVKHSDSHDAIVSKVVATGPSYLASDVLPEYLAAIPRETLAAGAAPDASKEPVAPPPGASTLPSGVTVPIDSQGTAYTPEQGVSTFRQALEAAQPRGPGLPSPVTTVDTQGNALDSGAFSRQLAAERDVAQRKIDLGLTPDVERAQQVRAAGLDQNDLMEQSHDDAPPWWYSGQREQQAHDDALEQLRAKVPGAPDPLAPDQTKLDTSHDVPLGGGVSTDNKTTYIDPSIPHFLDVPKEDGSGTARVDIWDGIKNAHEAAEKPALDRGKDYGDAHDENANTYEDAYYRSRYGVTRAAVDEALEPYIAKAATHAGSDNIPADLDTKPYVDGGDEDMLKSASPELQKLNIPAELHPQAMEFLAHVERALDAGIPPEELHAIARGEDDLPAKLTKIDNLIGETGHAHSSDTEAQGVPRETPADAHGEAGQAGEPPAQQEPAQASAGAAAGEHEPALSDRPDQLAEPADGAGGVPVQYRRGDWTPEVQGRAITAIDDLVSRYGGSTLADSIAQDLRETTTAQLIGKTVTSPEDLAALASVYRNPAFETMRYIYVDKAGMILGESAVSSRMPSTTKAFPTGTKDGSAWIKDQAPSGAKHVWLMHNHPSGNPQASKGDIQVTEALSIFLGDMAGAPKLAGHVILDHDTYGHIDALGDDQGVKPIQRKSGTGDVNRVQRGDAGMFDLKMTDPNFAAITGKRIYAATPSDSSALVIMDAQRRVVSVHTFPNDFLASPRGAAMVGRLGVKRGAVGIGLVTDATSFARYRQAFNKATQRGLLRDAIVVSPKGTPLNLAGTELFPQANRKNFGQQSAGTQKRSEAAVRAFEQQPSEGTPMVSLSAVRRALAERGLSEDQIKAMSPDQLRAEQANLRRRSPPAPEETQAGETSSITNATLDEERAMKGKDALQFNQSRENADAAKEATDILRRDPQAGSKLANDILDKERALTQVESFVLRQDRQRIKADRRAAFAKIEAARASGDELAETAARVQADIADEQMEVNEQALKTGKGLAAQALQANRDLDDDSYSMSRMVNDTKERKGAPLSSPERDALEKKAAEIEKREQAVAAREQALRDAKREPRKPAEQKAAQSKFESLAEQLKAIAKKDQLKPGCVS